MDQPTDASTLESGVTAPSASSSSPASAASSAAAPFNRKASRRGLRQAVAPAPPLPNSVVTRDEQRRMNSQASNHNAKAQTAAQPPLTYTGAHPPGALRKHSHGLSWSSHTRDSLVDNLLLSLDSITDPAHEAHPSGTNSRSDSMSQFSILRPRPSDLTSSEPARTNSPPRHTSTPSHHRRPSAHSSIRIVNGPRGSRQDSIDRPSLDMARQSSFVRSESRSNDMAGQEYMTNSPTRMNTVTDMYHESILSRGRPLPSASTSASPAPEPTVPSGPASSRNVPSHLPKSASNPSNLQRARSAARGDSYQSHHDQARSPPLPSDIPDEVRSQAGDFVRAANIRGLQTSASVSAFAATPPGSMHKYGQPQDEKRGFFKRVFGSSSSKSNLATTDTASSGGSPSVTRQGSAVDPHYTNRDPSPAPAPPARELNKKSSSFFRRRKKSVVDPADVPSIPSPFPSAAPVDDASTPARSSLYKAMDPFLAEPQTTPTRLQARPIAYEPRGPKKRGDDSPSSEDTNDPALFHSGYKPAAGLEGLGSRRPSEAPSAWTTTNDPRTESNGSAISPSMQTAAVTPTMPDLVSFDSSDFKKPSPPQNLPLASRKSFDHSRSGSKPSATKLTVSTAYTRIEGSPSETPSEDVFLTPQEHRFPPGIQNRSADVGARITTLNDVGAGYEALGIAPTVKQDDLEVNSDRTGSADPARNMSVMSTGTTMTSVSALMEGPTFEDRAHALSIYNGEEEFMSRAAAATFLGERKVSSVNTLIAYMELFNFTNQTILGGMRMLCNKLVLKAESQQVDRILDAFAARWCECNPNHGFKVKDVVHTMCYSLLLLNTDLHMADIESKMTRGQFVKNTLPTIKRVLTDVSPNAFEHSDRPTPTSTKPGMQWHDSSNSIGTTGSKKGDAEGPANEGRRPSMDSRRPTLGKRMSWSFIGNKDELQQQQPAEQHQFIPNSGSTALVSEKFDGKATEWHYELEAVLKSCFTAIKTEALPLVKADNKSLQRRGSIKSMAPSEISFRSKKTDFHSMRWGKNRTRNRLYGSSTHASSRTSFDDGSSLFSPAGSSAWSKLSMGKTLTTMSGDSMGASYGADQGFPQTIGFANALSQTIAREDGTEDDNASINPQKFLLEDDTLELAGAPWAKEGMVKHKHHLETTDKKAKERNWNECFAVVEKGYLRLFSFNSKGGKSGSLGVRKSMQRGKAPSIGPSVVGGGNWMQNAENMGNFLLRQTIASTLPPPGYSKARPHVWALSLPTGAVHLFQVGTADIANEFMITANYWSARLSKEPLMGGVDNIEYGWSDAIVIGAQVHPALLAGASAQSGNNSVDASASPNPDQQPPPLQRPRNTSVSAGSIRGGASSKPPSRHGGGGGHSTSNSFSLPMGHGARASFSTSMRGSIDHGSSMQTTRTKLPGDRAHLEDWAPPSQSMMASQLMAVDQLQALKDYVAHVEGDLEKHNELRSSLPNAYTPRHPNLSRAIANWEKKSAYLLREIVKFRTYIDALNHAVEEKKRFTAEQTERAAEKEERERKKRELKNAGDPTAAAAAVAVAAGNGNGTGNPNEESTPRLGSGDDTPTAASVVAAEGVLA